MEALGIGAAYCEEADAALLAERQQGDRANFGGIAPEQVVELAVACFAASLLSCRTPADHTARFEALEALYGREGDGMADVDRLQLHYRKDHLGEELLTRQRGHAAVETQYEKIRQPGLLHSDLD